MDQEIEDKIRNAVKIANGRIRTYDRMIHIEQLLDSLRNKESGVQGAMGKLVANCYFGAAKIRWTQARYDSEHVMIIQGSGGYAATTCWPSRAGCLYDIPIAAVSAGSSCVRSTL